MPVFPPEGRGFRPRFLGLVGLALGCCLSGVAAAQDMPPPLVEGAPQAQPPPNAAAAESETTNPGGAGVNLKDRVKSVQPKSFRMAHRLSVTLDGTASLNDAFFQKWGGGGQVAFALSDPFALDLHFDYYGNQETENVVVAKQVLSSQLYATRLRFLGGLDLVWTPIYGKVAAGNSIVHFDLYVLVGADAADGEQGVLPAGDLGLGERVFFTDWFSAGVEARYALYVDHAAGEPSMLQKSLLASAVATFWIPSGSAEESK